jgi:hypothetical protein
MEVALIILSVMTPLVALSLIAIVMLMRLERWFLH